MPAVIAANHVDTLMEGKNLAVVTRYARVSPVVVVRIRRSVTDVRNTILDFEYDDGAHCVTYWADWRVALDWIRARRSWSVDRVLVSDGLYAVMCADGSAHKSIDAIRARGTLVHEMG